MDACKSNDLLSSTDCVMLLGGRLPQQLKLQLPAAVAADYGDCVEATVVVSEWLDCQQQQQPNAASVWRVH